MPAREQDQLAQKSESTFPHTQTSIKYQISKKTKTKKMTLNENDLAALVTNIRSQTDRHNDVQ